MKVDDVAHTRQGSLSVTAFESWTLRYSLELEVKIVELVVGRRSSELG
jgi:hypothetical protein